MPSVDVETLKRQVGERAAALVEDDMVVGLGTGSTAAHAIRALGLRLREGSLRNIRAIATSSGAEALARQEGIPLTTLEAHPAIDLTIDGADEVAPNLDLIKGLGAALLREKIVAQATRREVIIVDATKLVPRLGTQAPLPVEVIRFGWKTQEAFLRSLGARPEVRLASDGQPLVTDEGNFILDCWFEGGIDDPEALATVLAARAGIVEHGLFLGLATEVIVATPEGIQVLKRTDP